MHLQPQLMLHDVLKIKFINNNPFPHVKGLKYCTAYSQYQLITLGDVIRKKQKTKL